MPITNLTIEVEGAAELIGTETADPRFTGDLRDSVQPFHHGRMLGYLKVPHDAGAWRARFTSPGLEAAEFSETR